MAAGWSAPITVALGAGACLTALVLADRLGRRARGAGSPALRHLASLLALAGVAGACALVIQALTISAS